jgi:RNA polymerase II subunit A-like phosphatase
LRSRKLSLIVDLDQTIIHTTVDPTVGEWMAEIEREKGRPGTTQSGETTTPPGSPLRQEQNPFEEALRDVAKFEIADDLPAGYAKRGGTAPSAERWYFTKPR